MSLRPSKGAEVPDMNRKILSFAAGVLVLGLMGWGIYEGVSSIAEKLQPEQPGDTSIALSAGFVPAPPAAAAVPDAKAEVPLGEAAEGGGLEAADPGTTQAESGTEENQTGKEALPQLFEIQGSVQRDGLPIPSGKVRLTVSLVGERFRQSALTDLKEGEFSVHDHPAFRRLRPKNRIRVLAEVWPVPPDAGRVEPLAETIYLNHHLPSWIRSSTGYAVLAGVLLFAALFLWSFTGRSTYTKNRLAIVLSYSVILLALAGALVGPTLLMLGVPDLPEISGRVPVGLVVAKLTEDSNPEWMLNLGGYVGEGKGERETMATQPADGKVATTAKDEDIGAPVLRVVTLNGGIQIPLYVILLALIGGAINMTRQVPIFQSREEEHKAEDERAWRKGLLDQYMFLIAAPFLAIATYYLLILLGTIQPPIIVLVCFSIGLISDTVVTAITEAAKKLLGGGKAAGQPEHKEPKDDKPKTETEAANANEPMTVPIHGEEQTEEPEEKAA
jgi:hypothetical protein